jgi:hypothetical protein
MCAFAPEEEKEIDRLTEGEKEKDSRGRERERRGLFILCCSFRSSVSSSRFKCTQTDSDPTSEKNWRKKRQLFFPVAFRVNEDNWFDYFIPMIEEWEEITRLFSRESTTSSMIVQDSLFRLWSEFFSRVTKILFCAKKKKRFSFSWVWPSSYKLFAVITFKQMGTNYIWIWSFGKCPLIF